MDTERAQGESLEYRFYSILRQDDESVLGKMQELIREGLDIHNIYNGYTTAIHIASEFGNLHLVNALLRLGSTPEDILRGDTSDNDTALHIAAIGGNSAVFNRLLQALKSGDQSPNRANKHGMTPLHYALGKGKVEMAEQLLRYGADVRQEDKTGATPLHFAARSGNVSALELVFKELNKRSKGKPDVNESNKAGLTALHYAAWNDKVDAIKWLIDKGGDLTKEDEVEHSTPLHWAAMRENKEAVEVLVRAHVRMGMRVFKENGSGKSVLELVEEHGREHVKELLRVVSEEGLLDKKAFPQMTLVRYVMGYGDFLMIHKLEWSLSYAVEKKKGYSVKLSSLLFPDLLSWVAKRGNKESIKLLMKLLKKYVKMADEDFERQMASALHLALLHKKYEFATSLAEHKYCKEKLPLVIRRMKQFLGKNSQELLLKLKSKDAEFFEQNLDKLREDIPFPFWAFYEDRQDIAKFIDAQGAWVGIINEQGIHTGRTAIHWATIFGMNEVVTKLCDIRECRAHLDDKHGKCPYWYTVEQNQDDIRKSLSGREDVRGYLDLLYRDRQVFVDALNAILVGAALIASITFQGFLQPPRGYRDNGEVYIDKIGLKLFWGFDSLSFFFAMASTLAAAKGVLPMPDVYIQEVVNRIKRTLFVAGSALAVSITFGLLAFGAAGFSVIPSTFRYQINMITTSAVGGLVSFIMLMWFLRGLFLLSKSYFSRQTLPVVHLVSSSSFVKGDYGHGYERDEHDDPDDKHFKYEVGPNYSEYPWQDGLDKLYENTHAAPVAPSEGTNDVVITVTTNN